MATNILMPALSPTMEEGTLAKWLKKEGDTVKAGEIIAEIETDKATMEFEAVDEGTLGQILVAAGTEGVKVNTPIAVLLAEGEAARGRPGRRPRSSRRGPQGPYRRRHPCPGPRRRKHLARLARRHAHQDHDCARGFARSHVRRNAP